MKRFLILTALVVAGALGSADKASAQVSYGYTTYNPWMGAYVGRMSYATPFGAENVTNYYSPYTGLSGRQFNYANVYGGQLARTNVYSPWGNLGYRTGYTFSPGGVYPGFYGPSYSAPYANRYGYLYRR